MRPDTDSEIRLSLIRVKNRLSLATLGNNGRVYIYMIYIAYIYI